MRGITKPYVGQRVRVRGQRKMAIIFHVMKDIDGGVILDRHIDGTKFWNVDALVRWRWAGRDTQKG